MKKLFIATLVSLTALSSLNAVAHTPSYKEKDLIGTWQCEGQDEDISMSFISEYMSNNTAIYIGRVNMPLDEETILSYDIETSYRYHIKGNQLFSAGQLDKFEAKHTPETLAKADAEMIEFMDIFLKEGIEARIGEEESVTITQLTKNTLSLTDEEGFNSSCKRIKTK